MRFDRMFVAPNANATFGMSTGQACRACLLNSACLRASGASPRHSASLRSELRLGKPCARSSKRAGGFIPRIALDQCRVPERYRTRVPFSSPSLKAQSGRILRVRLPVRVRPGTPICGCGLIAECGRAKAETTVRLRSPAPFPSLWCNPINTPASHAGDHRSEAGQGANSHRPQSIVSDAFAR